MATNDPYTPNALKPHVQRMLNSRDPFNRAYTRGSGVELTGPLHMNQFAPPGRQVGNAEQLDYNAAQRKFGQSLEQPNSDAEMAERTIAKIQGLTKRLGPSVDFGDLGRTASGWLQPGIQTEASLTSGLIRGR